MADAWSAFYWRDYIADIGHVTPEQHGAHLLLMAHYYVTRRPLSEPISYFETLRARNRQSGPRAPGWKRYLAKG